MRKLILDAARDSVREGGVASVSSRKIARRIGYTVGTVFQVFGSMDRLIAAMNVETLEVLYQACLAVPADLETEERLRGLAQAFLDFARAHPAEWDAVISYQYTTDQTHEEGYQRRIQGLLRLISDAIADFYGPEEAARHEWDVRLLWTSLYGIFVLSAANRLTDNYDAQKMVDGLIGMYLAARSKGQSAQPRQ